MVQQISNLINIRLLSERKKIIPIQFKNGDIWHTDIKLPEILITSNIQQTVTIDSLSVSGLLDGSEVVRFLCTRERLIKVIKDTNMLLNRLFQNKDSQWSAYNLHMLFGEVVYRDELYSETNSLAPGDAVSLRLNELIHFHYSGWEKIDHITCQIGVLSESATHLIEFPFTLTPYQCVGKYIFPLRGSATVVCTPWNQLWGHRMAFSQEFAFDVVDFQRGTDGEFSLSSPAKSTRVDDYHIFEREVLAIGDGTIVAAGSSWPNAWAENPLDYSEKRIIDLTLKLLEKGMEFNHAILGNYVIIDHHNGEFSVYAHMSEGSVTAREGDMVRQGDIIGRVGNTSNSDSPHLHFQLMDSGDFQTGIGLPVQFINVDVGKPPIQDYQDANSFLYSDYIFIHVGD